jgi:hypothetical protein
MMMMLMMMMMMIVILTYLKVYGITTSRAVSTIFTGASPSAWQTVLRVTKFWQRQAQTTKYNADLKHDMNPVQA